MRKHKKSYEQRREDYLNYHKWRKIKYLVFWGVVFTGLFLQKPNETMAIIVLWLAACEIER